MQKTTLVLSDIIISKCLISLLILSRLHNLQLSLNKIIFLTSHLSVAVIITWKLVYSITNKKNVHNLIRIFKSYYLLWFLQGKLYGCYQRLQYSISYWANQEHGNIHAFSFTNYLKLSFLVKLSWKTFLMYWIDTTFSMSLKHTFKWNFKIVI